MDLLYYLILLIVFVFPLSLLIGYLAMKKGRSYFGYFILSFFFSPLVGFLVLIIVGDSDELIRKKNEDQFSRNYYSNQTPTINIISNDKKYESIEKLGNLLKNGLISNEEFETEKKKI